MTFLVLPLWPCGRACALSTEDSWIFFFFFCVPQLYLWGSPFFGEIFAYVTIFESNHWGSHMLSMWILHAGCVFVADIHLSWTWMSGSFESVQWNACVHRLDLRLYSHLKEFLGNGVRTHVNSRGKIPSTWIFFLRGGSNLWHCIRQDSEPNTLPTGYSSPLLWISPSLSCVRDFETCTEEATLPGAWCGRVSARTGSQCVSTLWLT